MQLMMRLLVILALMLPTSAFAELEFSDARIKNLPATVPVRAGYVSIHNKKYEGCLLYNNIQYVNYA